MNFGTYHVFQCPPWLDANRVMVEEIERAEVAEILGYDMSAGSTTRSSSGR